MPPYFISYARKDAADLAERLYHDLAKKGVPVWRDTRDLKTTQPFDAMIENAIREAPALIVIISPDVLREDSFVRLEIQCAREHKKPIIPLKRPGTYMPITINLLTYIPFDDYDLMLPQLLQRLKGSEPEPNINLTALPENTRGKLLKKIHTHWLESGDDVYMNLAFENQPDAVKNPIEFSENADMLTVFDQVQRRLLILGAPGSGKTTLMLSLLRRLLDQAQQDEQQPIPILLNLSSWTEGALANWIVDELFIQYQLPKETARCWIEYDQFILMFDGLDEVGVNLRAACVEAINAFSAAAMSGLVVSCRFEDYQKLPLKLRLNAGLSIKPLTPEQISDYLTRCSAPSTVDLLAQDETLRNLAQTPFLLNMMANLSENLTRERLPGNSDPIAERLKQLLSNYVKLQLSTQNSRYSPKITREYLRQLACYMQNNNQSSFYIEGLQAAWLQNERDYRRIGAVVFVMLGAVSGLVGGAIVGIITGMLAGTLNIGLYFGPVLGGLLGLWLGSVRAVGHLRNPVITSTEKLHITYSLSVWGLLFGVVMGMSVGFVGWLAAGFAGAAAVGVPSTIFAIIASGLKPDQNIDMRIRPNHGTWLCIRNILRFTVLAGIVLGVCGWVIFTALGGLAVDPLFGFIIAIIAGLTTGLGIGFAFGGGDMLVKHILLRVMLWMRGDLPWNLRQFLDDAADKRLLRKVGGGYIFMHRYLLEYFAAL